MSKIVVCPHCHAKHPGSRMICTQCGEGLLGVERIERDVPSPITTQTTAEWIECPTCKVDNSRYQLNCWHCGERLTGAEPSAIAPVVSTPVPATTTWQRTIPPPEKPVTRQQLAFSLGLFFLIILLASIIFQEVQPMSRVIFMLGILIGFFWMYVKNHYVRSSSSPGGGYFTESPFPGWLIRSVCILVLIIALIFIFGWDFAVDWLFSQNPGERFLSLGLGLVFGGVIEYSLDYLLQVIAQMRSS